MATRKKKEAPAATKADNLANIRGRVVITLTQLEGSKEVTMEVDMFPRPEQIGEVKSIKELPFTHIALAHIVTAVEHLNAAVKQHNEHWMADNAPPSSKSLN